jgi:hypothetical protein
VDGFDTKAGDEPRYVHAQNGHKRAHAGRNGAGASTAAKKPTHPQGRTRANDGKDVAGSTPRRRRRRRVA